MRRGSSVGTHSSRIAGRGDEVVFFGGPARDRVGERLEPVPVAREDDFAFGREVAEEGRLRHLGSLGDLVHCRRFVAVLGEELERRVADRRRVRSFFR